ncbi:MAG: response regulator transcription factor [Burkholderiales bacterium]|nr:response regulator transcription factor [Burkholderiales bacterium]
MRILIAEDDRELAEGLVQALRCAGHAVDSVGDGRSADAALRGTTFDLLILDLALPEMHGFEVLRRLRAQHSTVLVLILSAEDEIDARIRGLDLGADDYLTKPFALGELEARIRALGRRAGGPGVMESRCGPLVLDSAGQRVVCDGRPLDLTRAEYMLLATLIERCGKVVSKSQLFERLYDWDADAGLSAVEVFMCRIRRKIEASGVRVRTVRGLGYLLEQGHATAPEPAPHDDFS